MAHPSARALQDPTGPARIPLCPEGPHGAPCKVPEGSHPHGPHARRPKNPTGKFLQRIASVLERLSAVGKILDAVRSTPKFQEHCVRQARRVQESVKSTFLNADELAEVTAAISRVGFSSDVELELITKFFALRVTPPAHHKPDFSEEDASA